MTVTFSSGVAVSSGWIEEGKDVAEDVNEAVGVLVVVAVLKSVNGGNIGLPLPPGRGFGFLVSVGVRVEVAVDVDVEVAVCVGVKVMVLVGVKVAVKVAVDVKVEVGVCVKVAVGV